MKHYICIDIEMSELTAAERELVGGLRNEVIEIGAVMLDESFNPVKKFTSYVKPAYSSVTPLINSITGITNEMLQDCDDLVTVMDRYCQWAGEEDKITFCWSSTDYSQLWNELNLKGVDQENVREMLKTFVDFQKVFVRTLEAGRNISVEGGLNLLCLEFQGHMHDATWDAFNTARILNKMLNSADLKVKYDYLLTGPKVTEFSTSSKYDRLRVNQKEYSNTMASFMSPELLSKFGFEVEIEEKEKPKSSSAKKEKKVKLSEEEEEKLRKIQYEKDIKSIKASKLSFTDADEKKKLCDKYKISVERWIEIAEKTLNTRDLKEDLML